MESLSKKTGNRANRRRGPARFQSRLGSRLLSYAAVPVLAALAPTAAEADFIGYYAVGNWTTTNSPPTSGGSVNTAGAPSSITLMSSDNGVGGSTDFTIAAEAAGIWDFDWSYSSGDSGCFDNGGWLLNGVYTLLACNEPGGSGAEAIGVNAGDIIGYRVNSEDGMFGPGSLTIRGFDAPTSTSVPEPSSLALLALGAAGLALARARRKKEDA